MVSLNIIFLGGQKEKLEELFPKIVKISIKPYGEKQIRNLEKEFIIMIGPFSYLPISFYLRAQLYPKLNEQNFEAILFDEILENIFKIDQKKFKNNWVIVIFGDEYADEISTIFNEIPQVNRPFLLFVSDNIDKILKNFDSKSPEIRKIGFLKQEQDANQNMMYGKLLPYFWSKLTYYNQLGNEAYKFLTLDKNIHGFCYIDILLIGDSRTGKSTFINLVSQKLTSLELSGTNSVTNKILRYEVYMDDILNDNNKYIANCPGGIRFTDTPGLIKKEYYEMIKMEVDLDKIDIIYFFTNERSNLENSLEMLKYIDKTNNKRIKSGLKKIPIIFIINGEDKSLDLSIKVSDDIKKFLFDNNLKNLYDEEKKEDVQNNNKINRIQALKEKQNKKKGNNICGNIINVNLLQTEYKQVSGINTVFEKTLEYIKGNNKFNDEQFKELDKMSAKLIELFIKDKNDIKLSKDEKLDLEYYYNKSKMVLEQQIKEYSLFNKLKNELSFKSKGIRNVGFVIAGISSLLLYLGLPFIVWGFLMAKSNLISKTIMEFGFEEVDIDKYKLRKYVYDESEDIENYDDKKLDKRIKKTTEFFKDLLYYTGPGYLACKYKEIYEKILNQIDELTKKNKEDWGKYSIEEIK